MRTLVGKLRPCIENHVANWNILIKLILFKYIFQAYKNWVHGYAKNYIVLPSISPQFVKLKILSY